MKYFIINPNGTVNRMNVEFNLILRNQCYNARRTIHYRNHSMLNMSIDEQIHKHIWEEETKNVPKIMNCTKSRYESPQKLTQLRPRSHPRHLVGKRTAQIDATKDTTATAR